MRRRAFLCASAAMLAAPLVAEAQPAAAMHRIGYLTPFSLTGSVIEAFRESLRERGYVEGKNIHIEVRSSGQQDERLPGLAAELVTANVDIIVTQTGSAALAVKQATSRIPIVMAGSADAVAQGLVASLARPGGNVTGFTLSTPEYAPKRVELLREALPQATRVTVIWCPYAVMNRAELAAADATARRLGMRLAPVEYRTRASWDAIVAGMERARPDAFFMLDCADIPFQAIADFTLRHRIPSFSPYPGVARLGVLLAYGAEPLSTTRRVAEYVDRLLRGAKPEDLPVQQPTTFELIINLKTAKALGLTIPPSLLARADQVIE